MTSMAKLLDAKHVHRRKKINMRAILVHNETEKEFYWNDISEDEEKFFLEGYVVERDGKTYECVSLLKSNWKVKVEMTEEEIKNDWRKGESKKDRKARIKKELEEKKAAQENENATACDIRSNGKQPEKTVLDLKYGETDAG